MRLLSLFLLVVALGCTTIVAANPDRGAINDSIELLLREGVMGEAEVEYIPENTARGDSYSLSYEWCTDNVCKVLTDLQVYWMSNYDKVLVLEIYTHYNGTVMNYTVIGEDTVLR